MATPLHTVDLARSAHGSRSCARELGFHQVGVAGIDLAEDEANLERWLAEGRNGGMGYMARHGRRRSRPDSLVPGTLRVISVRMATSGPMPRAAADVLADGGKGYVARYALGRDYHKVMRGRLQKLADADRGGDRRIRPPRLRRLRRRCWRSRWRAMPGSAGSASTPA